MCYEPGVHFRAFGIPTHVQFGFWFTAVLLGVLGGDDLLEAPHLLLLWIAIIFVSIMVHELGHAFAMIHYGLQPEITLYTLGGLTGTTGMHRLSRPQRIFVAFAGPLAGFIFGGLIYAGVWLFPDLVAASSPPTSGEIAVYFSINQLLWVNFGWGIINLVPVLPLDGGHILEDALGPRRSKLTATISLLGGAGVVIYCLMPPAEWWLAFLFGMFTMQSYQRFRMSPEATGRPERSAPKPVEQIAPEIQTQLAAATLALNDERYDEAGTIAELVLADGPPTVAKLAALNILGWAHLLEGRPEEAARVLRAIEHDGEADPALVGTVLMLTDEMTQARAVFEGARAEGDDRKEVVGPLIQILIKQGEVPRAAAIALDIVESLSEDDARQMATIAFEHEQYGWAARLSEAVFERTGAADDAYDGVRSRALDGDISGALVLLRRAKAAGFSDAARVWSDKALEKLRDGEIEGELEALLPRP